jgi:hypothetical protein
MEKLGDTPCDTFPLRRGSSGKVCRFTRFVDSGKVLKGLQSLRMAVEDFNRDGGSLLSIKTCREPVDSL